MTLSSSILRSCFPPASGDGRSFAYPYFGIVLMLLFIFPFIVVLLCVKTDGCCMANWLHFFEWFWLSLSFCTYTIYVGMTNFG